MVRPATVSIAPGLTCPAAPAAAVPALIAAVAVVWSSVVVMGTTLVVGGAWWIAANLMPTRIALVTDAIRASVRRVGSQ